MITGVFQPSDSLAASWVHVRPRRSYAIVGMVLLSLVLFLLMHDFFWEKRGPDGKDWFLLLIIIAFAIERLVLVPAKLRKAFRQRKDLQSKVTFFVSNTGIQIESFDSTSQKSWSDFYLWKEGKTVFLIYLSDDHYITIPKRFFSEPDSAATFRDILVQNISNKAMRKKA